MPEKKLMALLPEKVKRTSARDALAQLLADGTVQRLGGGVKGNPYRYWAVSIHSDGTPNTKRQNESKPATRLVSSMTSRQS